MPYRLRFQLDRQQQRSQLEPGEQVIGTAADCAIRIRYPTVSRQHARVTLDGDLVYLQDLDSSNGTWRDGQALKGRQRIAPGDRLRLGDVEMYLEAQADGDQSLAMALHPSLAQPMTMDALRQTLPLAQLDDFVGVHLAALLRCAGNSSPVAMAQGVASAALQSLPISAIEIWRDDDNGEVELLHVSGEPLGEQREVCEGGLRLRLWCGDASALAELPLALLRLVALSDTAGKSVEPAGPLAGIDDTDGDLVLVDPVMRDIFRRAAQVAESRLNLLILGESGTGKEQLAQFIRDHANDPKAPFVAINCAALPDDLIDAELFGIEKGVATGVEARAGKFEQADRGILFLDEIAEMSAATQARILRVLQEGEVLRIGGSTPRPARVRIIAATNADIDARVADGRFRLDLLHRIADWQVTLPPLRERVADIAPLALKFLEAACRERGVRLRGITRAACHALQAADWRGNVRELQREMARAAVFLNDGDALSSDDLRPALRADLGAGHDLAGQLLTAERRIVQLALAACGGNISQAAERLAISRSTLYRRMAALALLSEGDDPARSD